MIEILILAIALSMDAFAVSITLGIKNRKDTKILALKAGVFFGIFQAFMPLIGYLGGVTLQNYLQGFDKIIAFVLLLIIGIKMIYESFDKSSEDEISHISNKILFTLSVATSIDAMASGFTLHLFDLNIYIALFIIGIVTFILSFVGVYIGTFNGDRYKNKAELLGGIILILLGFKIVLF